MSRHFRTPFASSRPLRSRRVHLCRFRVSLTVAEPPQARSTLRAPASTVLFTDVIIRRDIFEIGHIIMILSILLVRSTVHTVLCKLSISSNAFQMKYSDNARSGAAQLYNI